MRVQKWPHGYPDPGIQVSDRSDTSSTPSPGQLISAEEWIGKPKRRARKKSPSASKAQVERAVQGFEACRSERTWGSMEPTHFLGLYVVCHRRVYGTDPADLFAAWAGAVGAVKAMLGHEFAGNPARLVAFLQWAWAREQMREKQRRSSGGADYRLAWRCLFVRQAAAGILTDWRTHLARSAQSKSAIKAR